MDSVVTQGRKKDLPGTALRILFVAGEAAITEQPVRLLADGGYLVEWDRVDDADSMARALTSERWDLAIVDHDLSGFSSTAALAVLHSCRVALPLIVLADAVSEALAVELMRAGAQDLLPKSDLARLVAAVERDLREAQMLAEEATHRELLIQSDRLASVGILAAGIVHEINNPLTAMIANVDAALEEIDCIVKDHTSRASESSPEHVATQLSVIVEPLRDALECAERVRHIVRDLRFYARADVDSTERVDVHRVVDSSLRMAKSELRGRVTVRKEYGEAALVEVNEARLGQIVLNLIINAAHALPLETRERNLLVISTFTRANQVVIEVRDNGVGMPREVLARAFDPFFTTKAPGVGTGLGLAICQRLANAMAGSIDLESAPGEGTVARISLPRVAERSSGLLGSLPPPPPAGRRARILVVEDELALGTAVQRTLSRDHDVELAPSGKVAMAILGVGQPFDVVLCDLLMPDVSGIELYDHCKANQPELAERFVFMTGAPFRVADFLNRVPNPRLEKPFDRQALREAVSGLLR